MIYSFKIDNDCLSQTDFFDGVSGNKNVYMCEFEITCEEGNAVWLAVFKKGDEAYVTPIAEGRCTFPYECLSEAGTVYLGCYAECEGNKRISTNWIPLNVENGAYSQGTAPQDPPEELWETLLSNSVPVIGENGHWFTYDMLSQEYVDTGLPSRGDQGVQGPQGVQGIQGEQGVKGDKGDKGDTGAIGPQGPKGDTGAQGSKGDKGDTGAQGLKGDKGDKGDTGAAGYTPQKGIDYFTESEIADIRDSFLAFTCPKTETTDLTITDAIPHAMIDYTIYGNTVDGNGVGDEVVGSNKYVIPIKFRGNNLFDAAALFPNQSYTTNGVTLTRNGQKFILNGERTDKTKVYDVYSEPMTLPAGSYTFTVRRFNAFDPTIAVYIYAGHNLIAISVTDNNYRVYTQRFTLEEETSIVFRSFLNYNNNSIYNNNEFVCQLVSGTYYNNTLIPYEPHFNYATNIYVDSPLMEGDSISFAETNIPLLLSQDTNIIEFGTSVQPKSASFKYYQDINKVIANLQALILNQ